MFCRHCGNELSENNKFCPKCGTGISSNNIGQTAQTQINDPNTSGYGDNSVVPEEIQTWNWGAFGLNWIWGLGNSTYIALLCLIPYVGFVMAFVLGAKGNEWAWKNQRWNSVEDFKKTQRKWRNAFFIFWAVLISLVILLALAFAGNLFGHSTPPTPPPTNQTSNASSCPDTINGYQNASGNCVCNTGYTFNNTDLKCEPIVCGKNAYLSKNQCYCNTGFTPDTTTNDCVKSTAANQKYTVPSIMPIGSNEPIINYTCSGVADSAVDKLNPTYNPELVNQLNQMKTALDSSTPGTDSYNYQLQQYNNLESQYQTWVNTFNNQVSTYNSYLKNHCTVQ